MNDPQIYAWIFLSVDDAPCSLQDIIAMADGINHAIPSQKELQTSLGWLKHNGLVRKEGKKYCLTNAGVELRKRMSAITTMKTWDNTTAELSRIAGNADPDEDVTPRDVSKAYQGYKKWFWQEYRKLKENDAQQGGPGYPSQGAGSPDP